jgi:hypothetical protein
MARYIGKKYDVKDGKFSKKQSTYKSADVYLDKIKDESNMILLFDKNIAVRISPEKPVRLHRDVKIIKGGFFKKISSEERLGWEQGTILRVRNINPSFIKDEKERKENYFFKIIS